MKKVSNMAGKGCAQYNPYIGCAIVATEKLENFIKKGIKSMIVTIAGITYVFF